MEKIAGKQEERAWSHFRSLMVLISETLSGKELNLNKRAKLLLWLIAASEIKLKYDPNPSQMWEAGN